MMLGRGHSCAGSKLSLGDSVIGQEGEAGEHRPVVNGWAARENCHKRLANPPPAFWAGQDGPAPHPTLSCCP